MKRCSKCILPESTPGITFDNRGVCNYCRTYHRIKYMGERELLQLLDSHRRTDSRYDCIVPISGGRDSTYTILKLVRDYGMKVLAVNYENPFTCSQARSNIETAIGELNVDMVGFKLKNRIHERTLKSNTIAWFRKPSPGLVPIICIACKTMWWDILRIARKYDIHCVVSGGNRLETTSFKKVLLGSSAAEPDETAFIKSIFGILRGTFENPAYLRWPWIPTMVKGYLFGDPYAIGSRIVGHNITRIDLFFLIEWSEQEVLSRIESELGWDYPRELNSSWRFDCRVGHLKDFMYIKTMGMTERDDFYAKMVREGMMTRDHASLRLHNENKLYLDKVEALLNEVGIEDLSFLREPKGGSII